MKRHVPDAWTVPIAMLGAALIVWPAAGALAQDAAGVGSTIRPVAECASLASTDLSAQDAVVTSAAEEAREGHDYCFVQGYISPQTQFECCCRCPPGGGATSSRAAAASAASWA